MWRRREEERLLEEEERWYWEERRRYEEECEYFDWCRRYPRGPPNLPPPMMPPAMPRPPFMPGMPPIMVWFKLDITKLDWSFSQNESLVSCYLLSFHFV